MTLLVGVGVGWDVNVHVTLMMLRTQMSSSHELVNVISLFVALFVAQTGASETR